MMSKKTKAMEQQLTQLAQENDALRAQLAAAGVEIENVKSELAKTVGERDRFRNELNGAQLDLSNAKRRLDDFRLRQEAIVNALTEAHNTRERILKEANANADRIDAEAKQRRTDILNKAQAALESAKKEAAQLIADAKRDAAVIRDAAQKDAQQVTDTALDEATELIAGAKADAETMMDEAQAAVDEKQAQVDELNFSLSEKARLALEQARKYAQIMESLAELNFETAVEARYTMAISFFVYSGTAEFLLIAFIVAGESLLGIFLTLFLLGFRHFFYKRKFTPPSTFWASPAFSFCEIFFMITKVSSS